MIERMLSAAIGGLEVLRAKLARPAPRAEVFAPPAPAPVVPAPLPPAPVRSAGTGDVVMRMTEREAEVLSTLASLRPSPIAEAFAARTCDCPECAPVTAAAKASVDQALTLRSIGERAKSLGIDRLAEQLGAVPVPAPAPPVPPAADAALDSGGHEA